MSLPRCLAVGFLGGLLLCQAPAAEVRALDQEWKLPPLEGEIEGDFRPLTAAGAPSVHWKLALKTLQPGVRTAEIALDGPGARAQVELRLDPAGNGTWRVPAARIDAGIWSAASVAFLGEEFSSTMVQGQLSFAGEGTLRDGVPDGRAQVVIRQGRVEDPQLKLLIEGIAVELAIEDIGARRSAGSQSLTWDGGTYETIPFGRGHVTFSLRGDEVHVEEASAELFGGELVIAAFTFSTVRGEASVIARVIGIEVGEILPLLPPVLSSARGRVDGSLALHRTPAGVQIGSGTLTLRPGETAQLRLAPTPGLLSGSLPDAVLKYYPGLGKIETGEVPIRAERLEVAFTPGGDVQGRTASIRVVGGPVDPNLTAPIDLNINVRGPLESLIKFGTDSRIRFGAGQP